MPRGNWLEWLAEKLNANPVKLADYNAKRADLMRSIFPTLASLTSTE